MTTWWWPIRSQLDEVSSCIVIMKCFFANIKRVILIKRCTLRSHYLFYPYYNIQVMIIMFFQGQVNMCVWSMYIFVWMYLYMHACEPCTKVEASSTVLCTIAFEVGSLTEPESTHFSWAGLPVSYKDPPSLPPSSLVLESHMCNTALPGTWVLEIWTRVLMLACQILLSVQLYP